MRRLTGKQVRRLIAQATEGYRELSRRLLVIMKFRNPRIYDDDTDFDDVKEESGVYIIYCCEHRRTPKTRVSRILYIGRGWVGSRLLWHKLTRRGLEKFAREHTVKFAFCPIHDETWEFILEGILLNEHDRLLGCLPYFNINRGSKTLLGWHDVLTMRPGPKRILNKYGA